MNYRHIYHAGNFADCLKHAALMAVLLHLRKKETPFAVIDTHAGRGLYDIAGVQAKKTEEAADGILRLLPREDLPGVLATYRDLVRSFGEGHYPGSPLIALKLLRPQDRLVAVEKHPEEHQALAAALGSAKGARAILGDGYHGLERLLPPKERRGLVLIDPPYEADDEFATATRSLIEAHRRFPRGNLLFWYPVKAKSEIAATEGELLNAGIASVLKLELDVDGADTGSGSEARGPRLTQTGMLAINPPFGFAQEMRVVLAYLANTLGRGRGARGVVEVLTER
jgi:23S rRNA (adenine2030-N6)-methyltransferase